MTPIAVKIIIAAVVVGIICIGIYIYLSKLSAGERKEKVMGWLLQAVLAAEREFGSGTGKLKLSSVYSSFVTVFPAVAEIITWGTFCKWVDESLEEMRHLLNDNKKIAGIVDGGDLNE